MKKVVALLLVSILLVTLMVPAFAGPVEMCPDCSGALERTWSTTRVESKSVFVFIGIIPIPMYAVYEVETTYFVCSNTVHKHEHTRFLRYSSEPENYYIC
ncbi:hypothetical protein [Aristaeella lactis]|uniref:Uncharacterized protein n=1 Tax=Aristaeella lactis TaxID=3046383 RepID=A0AC61PHE7_9FIRM|nr:hypothetical protein [Aristaeella lactis]QUA53426.1 hypothetical protein JYE50_01995 [Aristaeella lactis]SMC35145.1 hypothetical protein SAMN06297397_0182 [Aristaeella lactis]